MYIYLKLCSCSLPSVTPSASSSIWFVKITLVGSAGPFDSLRVWFASVRSVSATVTSVSLVSRLVSDTGRRFTLSAEFLSGL